MTDGARRGVSDSALLWIAAVLLLVYPGLVLAFFPERYVSLVTEGGLGEMTTAVALFGAAWLVGREAIAARRRGQSWAVPSLFAAGCAFVAFEEISWGQRLFGYGLDALQSANVQREVNLHNLLPATHAIERWLGLPLTLAYGVILPLVHRRSAAIAAIVERWNLPVPPAHAVPVLLGAATAFAPSIFFKPVEIAELWLALGLLLTAGSFSARPDRPRRSLLALASCVAIAMAVLHIGPRARLERREYETRLLIANVYYSKYGLHGNARWLLRQEARRFDGWLNAGTAVGALGELALTEYRSNRSDLPTPDFLDSARHRGRVDLANDTIDLAVLSRLAGHREEADEYLDRAESLLADGDPTSHAGIRARTRLLACRGRSDEARALIRSHFPEGFILMTRSELERVDTLVRLFASLPPN